MDGWIKFYGNFALQNKATEVIVLDPESNKTGHVWHVHLSPKNNPEADADAKVKLKLEEMVYGYKLDGDFCPQEGHYFDSSNLLLDPYAKAVVSRDHYGVKPPAGNCWPLMAGMLPSPSHDDDDVSCFSYLTLFLYLLFIFLFYLHMIDICVTVAARTV